MLDKIKIFILLCYNKSITLLNLPFFYILGKRVKYKREIDNLKNIYLGKRCFIICNGPSLRPTDLDKIHDNGDFSLGINIIARIYSETKWRPNVLILNERGIFERKYRKITKNCKAGLKVMNQADYLRGLMFKGKKIFVKTDGNRRYLEQPKFSINASEVLYSIGTSTYITIEFAHHLGFREIYLIGCDMSYAVNISKDGTIYYNDSGKNHFYKEKDDLKKGLLYPNPTWEQIVALDFADKFSRENGFRIYNATRGGCCESFERVDFDSLFPKQ